MLLKNFLKKFNQNKKVNKIAFINSIAFFINWLIISFAIADKPPPPGFILIILFLAIFSLCIYCYEIFFFIPYMISNRKYLFGKTLLHWGIAGIIVGLLFSLLPSGEPSIKELVTISDRLITIFIIFLFSIINCLFVYFINIILYKRIN